MVDHNKEWARTMWLVIERMLGKVSQAYRSRAATKSVSALLLRAERYAAAGDVVKSREALDEAVALARHPLATDPPAEQRASFMNGFNVGMRLAEADRHEEAIDLLAMSVSGCRALVVHSGDVFRTGLAVSLHGLGESLARVGRRDHAIEVMKEAVLHYRMPVRPAPPPAWLYPQAICLGSLSEMLSAARRGEEAIAVAHECVEVCRGLASADQWYVPRTILSLSNLGQRLCKLGRIGEALRVAQEALRLHEDCAQTESRGNWEYCCALEALGLLLGGVDCYGEATRVLGDAVWHARQLAQAHGAPSRLRLVLCLIALGGALMDVRRDAEAHQAWREAGGLVLRFPADHLSYLRLAEVSMRFSAHLVTTADVLDVHVPLLFGLTEGRELARRAEDAAAFLALCGQLAARIWELLRKHGPSHPELIGSAAPAIVSALHSPDLARWMQAQAEAKMADDSPGMRLRHELARIKREVIAADEVYHALLARLGHVSGGTDLRDWMRASDSATGSDALVETLQQAADEAERCRQRCRAKRAELIAADPTFRSTFEVPTLQALQNRLREFSLPGSVAGASRATPSSLLCLMTLKDADQPRAVGVLLSEAGQVRLIEFAGLVDLAQAFAAYEPEGDRGAAPSRRRLAYRRGLESGEAPRAPEAVPQPPLEELEAQLREQFWQPLHGALCEPALHDSPSVLHVCGHGALHQLPLAALAPQFAQEQVQLVQWPGLPYFRIAATGAHHENEAAVWQLGHDCAWQLDQPLPMAAVEAHLLDQMLRDHGRAVMPLAHADELRAGSAALVACCHGQHAAHFDSALALGERPLAVERIVARRLGPRVVLLPVCHAGETAEDSAGNALGVAAGFLLGGTGVVVASAKAVPDLLMPWFSTLLVWHIVAGNLGPYQAAVRARAEFGSGEFPPAYRRWLQQALPRALQTIQPGGSEWPAIIQACRLRATRSQVAEVTPDELVPWVIDQWPWAGDLHTLFDDDAARRQAATRAAVQHVLQPRSDGFGQVVRRMLREAAAFIFVYGQG